MAQILLAKYNRNDLWQAIEDRNYPEFEFGVQMIREEDEFMFDFDILDPTKIWPEEQVPVKRIGKMVLTHNTDNFFAETEQIAFHPGHVVPGIDFTNDPLLQGRLFSYTDTQLSRLGGPNFHEIPINRPVCPFHNNQRDGMHRMTINVGQTAYHKNSLAANSPSPASAEEGGYVHYQEKVEGRKVRQRSDSFKDHFSQAKLFWNSMTDVEKQHIIQAFRFELGKVKSKDVQQQVVDMFSNVDGHLAEQVAKGIGAKVPSAPAMEADIPTSPALSQLANPVQDPSTRKVAVLAADGFDYQEVSSVLAALKQAGLAAEIISQNSGMITSADGQQLEANQTFLTAASVLYDAVYVAGGKKNAEMLKKEKDPAHFVNEAYNHFKTVAGGKDTMELLETAGVGKPDPELGVLAISNSDDAASFIQAIAKHRHWNR